MAHGFLENVLAWVHAHPQAAIGVVFVVSVAESIFVLGLLVPGAIFMFTFGALIGAHAMSMSATFAAAVIGTFIGDGGSYVLGRFYKGRLNALPGLSRVPGAVARGETFFARHGGKGIVLGRLIGALRPIMPTVAGAAGLSPLRFAIMDVIATAVWAPIYILPGVVFGASVDLAAQVATRLAILLLGAAAIVWVVVMILRFVLAAGRATGRRYAERLLAWSRRHRRLGLLGPALADPRQPEVPALAVAASLLMLVTGALYVLIWGWHGPRYPIRFDALAYYLTQNLHTPIANALARVIAEVGSPAVYLPFAVTTGLVLALMGNRRAAAHWYAAIGFSALATLLLRWWLAIPAPTTFFHGVHLDPWFLAGGGQDLILCATIYGLAGRIIAARRPDHARPYYYSLTTSGVVLIALCRLYLGLDWASDLILGLTLAFLWINLLVLCYNRQRPRPVRGKPLLSVLVGCLAIAATLAVLPNSQLRDLPANHAAAPPQPLANWVNEGFRTLPSRIRDIAGHPGAPLNVQAAGDPRALVAALARAGWHPPPKLGPDQALRSLAPHTEIQDLAVLPRVHDGRRAAITLVHGNGRDEDPSDHSDPARWVLRLWPTSRVTPNRHARIWVGLVDAQAVDRELHMLATAADARSYAEATRRLADSLERAGVGHRMAENERGALLLIWSPQAGVDAKVAPD